jgi:hypothetical protein
MVQCLTCSTCLICRPRAAACVSRCATSFSALTRADWARASVFERSAATCAACRWGSRNCPDTAVWVIIGDELRQYRRPQGFNTFSESLAFQGADNMLL